MKKVLCFFISFIAILILLTLISNADELTESQKAEAKLIDVMMAEANRLIPSDTILTDKTFEIPVDNLVHILEKNGYTENEYYIQGGIIELDEPCVYYDIYIQLKTMDHQWVGTAIYKFEPEPKIKNAI